MTRRAAVAMLEELAAVNEAGGKVEHVTLAVTERYLRRQLRLRRPHPTAYAGIRITCIGSPAWRASHGAA